MPASPLHPDVVPPTQLPTSGVDFGGYARLGTGRDDVEPLTADLRRLHVTVSRQLLKKLDAARDDLSHSIPGATTAQVMEAALDLLLEKQARARGQVRKPRTRLAAAAPRVEAPSATSSPQQGMSTQPQRESAPPLMLVPTQPPPPRRTGPRETIPATVRRAVWERDQGRRTWPLDGGECCGSTHLHELDHIRPWARDGEATVANLRVVCREHNAQAARREYGARCVERSRASRRA